MRFLKATKSPGMDSILSELFKNGGEATTTVLTAAVLDKGVDTVTRHAVTKERQPQAVSELSYHQPN